LFAVYESMQLKVYNPKWISNTNVRIQSKHKQFNHKNNSQKLRTNEQTNTIKCNKFQVYMRIALEQCTLFHGREKIINKLINEIQKNNHKKNRCYIWFFISLPCTFFLSPKVK
jgi:hypothetical protein